MAVNNALKNLARDGRFSVDDAKTLKQLVQDGKVSTAEAKEALQRYGDVMDAEAGSLLEGFTGGTRAGALSGLPSATLEKTLAPGARGEDVRTLQHGLMTLGMREQNAALTLPTGADGMYGAETKSAVKAFQTAHGIQATGTADPVTLKAIDAQLRGSPQAPARSQAPIASPPAPSAHAPRPTRGLQPHTPVWQTASTSGRQSIADKEQAHIDAIGKDGIGNYYGDHGDFAAAVHRGDKAAVEAQLANMSGGQPGGQSGGQWHVKAMTVGSVTVQNASGESRVMKESSCIGWVMDNVKQAYASAGKGARFAEIEQRMHATGMRGTILCEELQKDGWSAVFYSPRTAADLDMAGQKDKLAALQMAQGGQRIWRAGLGGSTGVKPDAVVTGYRDSAPDQKTEDMLQRLERAPFLVGVANGGTHTFVGHDGNVTDFHWKAAPNDKDAVTEHSVRDWEWDTGLYMIPPGQWNAKPPAAGVS